MLAENVQVREKDYCGKANLLPERPTDRVLSNEETEYSDPEVYSEEDTDESDGISPIPFEDNIYYTLVDDEHKFQVCYADIVTERNPYFTCELRTEAVKQISAMASRLKNKLDVETDAFFIAVKYMDTVLSKVAVSESDFLLFLAVCFKLAVKLDTCKVTIDTNIINALLQQTVLETSHFVPPSVFGSDAISAMELTILVALDFRLDYPTPNMFIGKFLAAANPDDAKISELANVLIEMAALDVTMIDIYPSLIAVAAVSVACSTLGFNVGVKRVMLELRLDTRQADLEKCITACISYCQVLVASRAKIESQTEITVPDFKFDFDFSSELCRFAK